MAEQLSYDASEPTEVVESRAAEEADSLRVGEELAQAQEQLLAGKYKDAEELEKAYLELQGKLGESREEPVSSPQEQQEQPSTSDLLDKYLEGDKTALEGLSVEDMAEVYRQLKEPNAQPEASDDLTDQQVLTIYTNVGGEEQYSNMVKWAADNLTAEEIEAYDDAIDSGNMARINLALKGLQSAYQDSVGVEGKTLQGRTAPSSNVGYRSQAELIADMNDPRYDNDPAYRNDIMNKLANSPNLEF